MRFINTFLISVGILSIFYTLGALLLGKMIDPVDFAALIFINLIVLIIAHVFFDA